MAGLLQKTDLIYPELSYAIVGAAYEVHNEIGPGQMERTYQRAMASELKRRKIQFQEQAYAPVHFKGERVGTHYLDFVVEGNVIVELKVGDRLSRNYIDQVLNYLTVTQYPLALIIMFCETEVRQKRLLLPSSNIRTIRTHS